MQSTNFESEFNDSKERSESMESQTYLFSQDHGTPLTGNEAQKNVQIELRDSEDEDSMEEMEPVRDESSQGSVLEISEGQQVQQVDNKDYAYDEEEKEEVQNIELFINEQQEAVKDLQEELKQKEPKEVSSKFQKKMTLRSFQASLLDNSLERNSIIYLPTGTGKTRIAICAMYYYLSLYGEEKKIVFLANTIQLVKQQAEAIKQTFTGILQDKNFAAEIRQRLGSKYNELNWTAKDVANKITCIHGERNDDQTVTKRKRIETYMNSRKEFLNEMKKATITVMISQMFLNCLRRGYIKITDYSFVVFDECHHCDGDHPFSGIMKEFYFEQKRKNKRLEANNQPDDKNKLPYMMGLTASPVSQPYNDHAKLTKELRRLCINLDSNYASYPQGENLTNQTEIYIEKIVEESAKEQRPELIDYFQKYKDHKISYNKIRLHFPRYFKCVQEIVGLMSRKHECLKVEVDGKEIIDPQLYLFYDIKECLMIKLRDLWLELGQFAFSLGFHEMVVELQRLSGLRNQENTYLLNEVVEMLKRYDKEYFQEYGKCVPQFMSSKLNKLIEILKPQSEADIGESRVSDMVLVFAFKRRTVKYLQAVLEKYKDGLDENMKKFYSSVGVTGYASSQKVYRKEDGHSYQSNPSAVENEGDISKYYNTFLETEREQQSNRIHLNSSLYGDNKTLNAQMSRMYFSKMGKVLLEVEEKYSNQIRKIVQFKKKEHRVLITTSVTEQGFDIPGCNLVISFDTPFSLKSYIQIKGRARKKNSKYIIFTTEKDYPKMLENKKIYDNTINAIYELAINQIGKEEIGELDAFSNSPSYEKVATKGGAILNTNYALELLKSYFTSLKPPNRPYIHFIETTNICYKCIIKFPESSTSSLNFVVGKPYSQKIEALRSAAFNAVKSLKKQGFIRDDLRPSRLQQLQDEIELQKYDDLGHYAKDSEYKEIFDRYVQIEECSEQTSQRKLLRFYFKSLQPEKLEFPHLNRHFSAKQFEQDESFEFQIYQIRFENNSKGQLLREEEGINEIGILSCFEKEETTQMFAGFKQSFDETSQEYFQLKLLESDLRINRETYERYKVAHNFLLAGEKNNEVEYYNYLNNSPQVQAPSWNYKGDKKVTYKIDPTRKYFPLLVLLKKSKEGKYVVDTNAIERILKHIELFKKVYTFHNKPAKYIYDKLFQENLTDHYRSLSDQIAGSSVKESKCLIQAISKDFCFHKGLLTTQPVKYNKEIEGQQQSKKRNKLKFKYQKFKKMFIHFRDESNIMKEEVVKFSIWKQKSKDDLQKLLNKDTKIKKNEEDKAMFRFFKEFILYPVSYPTMIRISLAVKHVFPVFEDHTLALYFRKYYLYEIFNQLKGKLKEPATYRFVYYPNIILQNVQSVFSHLVDAGKSRYLRELGREGLIPSNHNASLMKIDMSSILQNMSQDQSMSKIDQSMTINRSSLFLQKADINSSIIERVNVKKEKGEKGEKKEIVVNIDILKELKIEDLLRALTSKIYKHEKSENYEEFEFIGDVVLKFLATIQIFLERTVSEEGEMHISRANLICNAFLHRAGIKKRLFQYIFTTKKRNEPAPLIKEYKDDQKSEDKQRFKNTDILLLGPYDNEEGYQYIPGKVHADAMESIIGIFYLKSKNLNDCQTLLYAFGILSKPDLHIDFQLSRDQAYVLPQMYADLEGKIGYTFKHKGLFVQALTHPTFLRYIEDSVAEQQSLSRVLEGTKKDLSKNLSFLSSDVVESRSKIKKHETFYERLQFLGDAFLDLLVVEYLYDQGGDYLNDEGALSFLKQSAVSNKTLGFIALKLGLQDHILMDLDQIDNTLKEFRLINKSLSRFPSPLDFAKLKLGSLKVLGDVFESLVGAILIDNEFRYEQTKVVVMNMIEPYVKHFTSVSFIEQSPTYKFKEYLDQNNYKKIKLEKVSGEGVVNGEYLYRFKDKSGNVIGEEIWASNEKDAWDQFLEGKALA